MSLGPTELLLILGIALIFFGPSRLPGLGRSLGDAIRGFKKGLEGEEEKSAKPVEQIREADRSQQKQNEIEKEKEKEKEKVGRGE
jgi:sec-independent protein translocase protein TatA